jgi:hypothetical protein
MDIPEVNLEDLPGASQPASSETPEGPDEFLSSQEDFASLEEAESKGFEEEEQEISPSENLQKVPLMSLIPLKMLDLKIFLISLIAKRKHQLHLLKKLRRLLKMPFLMRMNLLP